MATEYLDFELEIGDGNLDVGWPVSVVQSPAGNVRGLMRLPLDPQLLVSQVHSLDARGAIGFGEMLFERLVIDTGIYPTYAESVGVAGSHGKALRLKLRIIAPALATIPWELLYEKRLGEFVALTHVTPLIRFVEAAKPVQSLSVAAPLRILGMVVDPTGVLDLNKEKSVLDRAVEAMSKQGVVELTWLEGGTWRDLQRAMRPGNGPWHIFHFVGHGAFDDAVGEGFLILTDDNGEAALLSATELGRLLASHSSLRLTVLNACHSAASSSDSLYTSAAGTLIRRGVPAVIAMQFAIPDSVGTELGRTLFEALANGMSLEAAITEARIAVSLAERHRLDWASPVAYLRSPDGSLFTFASRKPERVTQHVASSLSTEGVASVSSERFIPMQGADEILELTEALARREVVPFVGAGFGVYSGLQDWYSLVANLALRSGQPMPPREWATTDALTTIVQTYANQRGLNSLITYLKDQLNTVGVAPSTAHIALASLPVDLVFAATLDDLLERAFRDAGRRVEVIVRDRDIPFMRRNGSIVNIVKLYGDLNQPDTLVLTRQQHEQSSLDRPQLAKLLETELGRSTLLYLAWSRGDPQLGPIIGELLARYGSVARMGYTVVSELTSSQADEFRRMHIQPVVLQGDGNRAAQLADWLHYLKGSD